MTVNPDEGMQLLTQRMSARRHVAQAETAADTAPNHEPGAAGPGLELGAVVGLMARATTALEGATAAIRKNSRQPGWDHVHPIEIPPGPQVTKNIPQGTPAAVTSYYSEPDLWGPVDGWAWRINGWSFVLGAGATGFQVWYDSPADPTNLLFSSVSSGRWEPSRLFLMPGRQLCFTANGGTLTVCKGSAEEIDVAFLPHYLAGSVARFL